MIAPTPNYTYYAEILEVVDGDTIGVLTSLGFTVSHGNNKKPMRFRFADIDVYETTLRAGTTPEEKIKGLEAKAWLAARLPVGTIVVLVSKKSEGEDAKFGRYLATVWHDGECINDKMVELGFTKPKKPAN
jgi:endonuclease YncB( thermonuclease family)